MRRSSIHSSTSRCGHRAGRLNTDFRTALGKVAYHAACHQRVQNIGMKTRDVLALVPDTEVTVIERCSGHDGTYAVKKEFQRGRGQNFAAGRAQGDRVEGRLLHQRLHHGRASHRKHAPATAPSPSPPCRCCARRTGSEPWTGSAVPTCSVSSGTTRFGRSSGPACSRTSV